jgi:hypothetical protein
LGGFVAAIAVIGAVLLSVTGTRAGRERILGITLEALGGQLSEGSHLRVGRLAGGLFTGARMYDIELVDPGGEAMVRADSAYINYELPTFFGGDVVINRLVLYRPEVLLYRLPGDSLWNYQHVLQDTTTDQQPGRRGRATIIDALEMVDGVVTVRLPWEPDEALPPAERAREIEAALSDTSRLAVESVPGGYLRTIVVRASEAAVEALTVAPDERGGTYVRVVQATAEVDLYRDEPLRVQDLQGELSLREGMMRYTVPQLVLPGSGLSSSGVIDLTGEEPLYDLAVNGAGVALRDLLWLYPALPPEGEASFRMALETTPETLRLRAVDLDFAAPGTRIAGAFEVVMGDSLLFNDISLRADPLDVNTVQTMLPVQIPVRGLRIGSVEIESPSS